MDSPSNRSYWYGCAIVAAAGLATTVLAQQAFYPRVNLTGWPGTGGGPDTDHTTIWTMFPGETRMGTIVDVIVDDKTPSGAWH
ncbi:MAG: hypothetical protein AB7Q00_11390 [Phycisphaerales bacterium]